MPNRLADESSPYLRQHAKNPVDWYPWGAQALDRAREEDRPILLSVGYSSCHWCHVMERESFEDPVIAALMNSLFVNIKVDREERPDIDQIYMRAVQAMTGRGGWPMTVFLTPERVPFFGGTYYPPEPRPGMPSFPQVLQAVADAWVDRREDVEAGSARLLEALDGASRAAGESSADAGTLERAYASLAGQYDTTHGGFAHAPKFPQPVTLEFLMWHHVRTGEPAALEMVVHTLRRMAAGGLRDHLGGGFHRYSVDARWLVPHFEKMLYDNALLASAYLDAYRLTDSDDLRQVATETLDYLAVDMRDPAGGFYAARDADSEGEEGLFYVWTPAELEDVLGPDDAGLCARLYGVTPRGNFEGRSILHLPSEPEAFARAEGISPGDLERRIDRARVALRERRERREKPFRDEKVIVAWNGLAIRAFAAAGAILGRDDYVSVAEAAADFIWAELRSDATGRSSRVGLLHSWIGGTASGPAFLDDHASLGSACLALHAATLERRWLDRAIELCDEIMNRFWDHESGTVYDTAHDAETLVVRPRDPMDNATPSGPSLAAELLARTGSIMDDERLVGAARRIVDREAEALDRFGPAFGRMLSVLEAMEADPVEIVIVGGSGAADADATRELIRAAHAEMVPNLVVAGHREGEEPPSSPLLANRPRVAAGPTAYVCRGYACRLPATTAAGLREQLRELGKESTASRD
jgi:uncharacterized protein YyaL (SSP411 family)